MFVRGCSFGCVCSSSLLSVRCFEGKSWTIFLICIFRFEFRNPFVTIAVIHSRVMEEVEITADIKNSKIKYITVSRMGLEIATFELENGVFYLDKIYANSPEHLFLSFKEVLDTEYGSVVVLYQQDDGGDKEIRVERSLIDSMFG